LAFEYFGRRQRSKADIHCWLAPEIDRSKMLCSKAADRLQRNFGSEFCIQTQFQKAAGLAAKLAILRQIPPGLRISVIGPDNLLMDGGRGTALA
jgi:hypothetical protein